MSSVGKGGCIPIGGLHRRGFTSACDLFYCPPVGIVTKQGDKGRTSLLSGDEVSKADARLEAQGALDELVACLGAARSWIEDATLAKEVRDLQIDLFRFGAEISAARGEIETQKTSEVHVSSVEKRIRALEERVALPRHFVIPGAHRASAALDHARAVARRFERRLVGLAEGGGYDNPHGLAFANRLSDYLFMLARAVEHASGVSSDTKG